SLAQAMEEQGMSRHLATMSRSPVIIAMALAAIVAVARTASAQDTVITGTITDSSDAVLPGVTVTAQHADTGNTFSGVTEGSGVYHIGPVRPGVYTATAELPGFGSMRRENIELLAGQRDALGTRRARRGWAG